MTSIIIGNIISAFAMGLFFLSTLRKTKKQILLTQSADHVLFVLAGTILKGYSGVVQDVISFIRNILIAYNKTTKWINILLVAAGIMLGLVFNNKGLWGLLPIIASGGYSVVVVHPKTNERRLKLAMIISALMWAVYCIVLFNYVNAVCNIVVSGSAAITLLRDKKKSCSKG